MNARAFVIDGAEFDAFNDGNAILVATKKPLGGSDGVGLVRNKDLLTEACP
ncbi:hypothetical protein [Corallococcus sp. 4LFB]|uniref:hypothetical protein n=1 Tax=Corallococcus sp. 4LFB TaxID=3383249 RepID=UPI00397577A0